MNKKDKKTTIFTLIGFGISVISLSIFLPKIKKIEDEEKANQYKTLGYYNQQISTDENRQNKKDLYSALATTPILITTCASCMYWIPTLLNRQDDKKENKYENM